MSSMTRVHESAESLAVAMDRLGICLKRDQCGWWVIHLDDAVRFESSEKHDSQCSARSNAHHREGNRNDAHEVVSEDAPYA